MRQFVAALNQIVSLATPPVNAVPFTLSLWARLPDVSGVYTLMAVLDTTSPITDMYWALYANAGVASFEVAVAPTYDLFSTTTSYRTNTWHHFCAVAIANNSRAVYLDAGGKATDTTSLTPTAGEINAVQIAAYVDESFAGYSNAMLADVAIYNVALSDADVYLLAKGRKRDGSRYRPWDVQRANLVSCPRLSEGGIVAIPDRITSVGSWTVSGGASPMPTPQFLRPVQRRRFVSVAEEGGAATAFPVHYYQQMQAMAG